ncbi:MAG TPA: hypothetical protein VHB49_09270 [Bradyrhizobium sp.]|nr:hypothetical protein [Bradyrhizobium sp.]
MWMRPISLAAFCLTTICLLAPAYALSPQEIVAKIKEAGYSQIGDIRSTPEGMVVKARKDGRDVQLVVDSNGQIKERD